jgi:enoyl-CoA hydratase
LVLGTRRFAAIVGAAEAERILGTSATFDAAEAGRLGFVQRVAEAQDWEAAVEAEAETAAALDAPSRAALNRALSADWTDADLADLVRSAARAGLKERISRYLAGG